MTALGQSYIDMAERIAKGHGFWNGNVLCCDPQKCKEKREELLALANCYHS